MTPRIVGALLGAAAVVLGCGADDAPLPGPSRRDGGAPSRAVADARSPSAPADAGGAARQADGGGAVETTDGGATDGGGAPVTTDGGPAPTASRFRAACRPATSVPSWPAIAWVGAASAIAYYDGDHTMVARVPDGSALDLRRETVAAAGAAPLAPPGLAAGRAGALLATIEGPGPSPRLLVRRLDASLARAEAPREIASAVDVRYGPAVLAFAGGWLVGWIDGAGQMGRAFVRRLAADGSPRGDAQVLTEPPGGAGGLTLDPWGDRALAAWIDPHLGFSPVSIAWSDASGVFAAPRIVTTTGSVNRAAFVSAAAGPDQAGLLVWGHVGPLGQDWLSRAVVPPPGTSARSEAVTRVDAYVTMRAAALRTADGWAVAWDSPTATGRAPPTTVRLQSLDVTGAARGAPVDVAQGFGVAATRSAGTLTFAFVRGLSVCTATDTSYPEH